MKVGRFLKNFMLLLIVVGCKNQQTHSHDNAVTKEFPSEMVDFIPYKANPVFKGTGAETWDKQIRERGYILYEDSVYKVFGICNIKRWNKLETGYCKSDL
jgi:hypothetical protein